MFERTKYPAIQDRMKSLIQNQEEALAAHELARSWMADQRKSMFVLFTKGDQVWLDSRNLKTRTIFHYQSTGTGYLQVATSGDLANPWCLPCCITTTIQGEWDLWRELCEATSRVRGRQRGLWHGNNPKSQEKRTRLSIFCQMVGISNHQCLMGTRTRIFKWWWHIDTLQTST